MSVPGIGVNTTVTVVDVIGFRAINFFAETEQQNKRLLLKFWGHFHKGERPYDPFIKSFFVGNQSPSYS